MPLKNRRCNFILIIQIFRHPGLFTYFDSTVYFTIAFVNQLAIGNVFSPPKDSPVVPVAEIRVFRINLAMSNLAKFRTCRFIHLGRSTPNIFIKYVHGIGYGPLSKFAIFTIGPIPVIFIIIGIYLNGICLHPKTFNHGIINKIVHPIQCHYADFAIKCSHTPKRDKIPRTRWYPSFIPTIKITYIPFVIVGPTHTSSVAAFVRTATQSQGALFEISIAPYPIFKYIAYILIHATPFAIAIFAIRPLIRIVFKFRCLDPFIRFANVICRIDFFYNRLYRSITRLQCEFTLSRFSPFKVITNVPHLICTLPNRILAESGTPAQFQGAVTCIPEAPYTIFVHIAIILDDIAILCISIFSIIPPEGILFIIRSLAPGLRFTSIIDIGKRTQSVLIFQDFTFAILVANA